MKKHVIALFVTVLGYLLLAAVIVLYIKGVSISTYTWCSTIFGAIGWTLISRYEIKRYRTWKAGQKEI